MPVYVATDGGVSLSDILVDLLANHEAIRAHERGSVTPPTPVNGQFWFRDNHPDLGDAIEYYNGSAWVFLMDPGHFQLNAGGTIPLAANLPCGGFKLTGMAAGSANGDSVRFEQVMLLSGANAMAGDLSMDGNAITDVADPTNAQDAATKAYVDSGGGGYFQTMDDYRANSKPVKYEDPSNTAGSFCELGFIPRHVRLRIYGRIQPYDGETLGTNGQMSAVFEADVDIWENMTSRGDTISGYPDFLVGTLAMTAPGVNIDVYVIPKTDAPQGCWIRLVRRSTGSYCRLRKIDNSSVDGAMQLIALRG